MLQVTTGLTWERRATERPHVHIASVRSTSCRDVDMAVSSCFLRRQEVRAQTRREEAAELAAGIPTWEVEVRALGLVPHLHA